MEPCGFCGGTGTVRNHQGDRYGPRPDYPETATCAYCDGTGQCEEGGKLSPQEKTERY